MCDHVIPDCVEKSIIMLYLSLYFVLLIKYNKQDQQGKAAFNERNPHMTQQQESQ
jgi:hypothetical protein